MIASAERRLADIVARSVGLNRLILALSVVNMIEIERSPIAAYPTTARSR